MLLLRVCRLTCLCETVGSQVQAKSQRRDKPCLCKEWHPAYTEQSEHCHYVASGLVGCFDTNDHNVTLRRLSHDAGVVQTVLDWPKSYLNDIVQSVHINGWTLSACPLTCVRSLKLLFGPPLSLIYTAPLSKIIRNNNFMSHLYTDDMRIYITLKLRMTLTRLLNAFRIAMKTNPLKLNDSKTEIIVFGSAQQLKKIQL